MITPQFARSLHGCPRIDDIDFCVLEIAHVTCHQYSTVRAENGGDLAVGLSYGSTRMTAVGCDHRVGSSSWAVERQNPIGEAEVEPSACGGLHGMSSSARRHDRNAIQAFRFAHRCQIQLLRVAVRDPHRDRRRRLGSHEFGRDIRV